MDLENGGEQQDAKKQNPFEATEDEDPWKRIQREQFVNSDKSAIKNCFGWVDYQDRVLSRRFQL